MKKQLLILTFLASACSTVEQANDYGNKPREIMAATVTQKFTEPVTAVSLVKIKQTNCAEASQKVSTQWSWKAAVEAASVCYKAKELAKVNALAEELSSRESTGPWGPYWMALLAYDSGQKERAEWMIELAYSRGSESTVINYLRGQIQWMNKRYHDAVKSFEAAVLKDDSLVSAHVLLGQVYYQDQDVDQAMAHFNGALKYESKNLQALYGLAECQVQKNLLPDAVSTLYTLADRDPADARYYQRIAEIEQNLMQDFDGAMKAYKKLQKNMKAGLVQKNLDPQLEMKIKQLENQAASREVANSNENKPKESAQ